MKNWNKIAIANIKSAPQPPEGYIRLSGPCEHDNIVNGDGLRAVVWTQGCPNHCPGCQNPETWDFAAGKLVKIEDVCKELKIYPGQAGVTFCGGEPFAQPRACREIAEIETGGKSVSAVNPDECDARCRTISISESGNLLTTKRIGFHMILR